MYNVERNTRFWAFDILAYFLHSQTIALVTTAFCERDECLSSPIIDIKNTITYCAVYKRKKMTIKKK